MDILGVATIKQKEMKYTKTPLEDIRNQILQQKIY